MESKQKKTWNWIKYTVRGVGSYYFVECPVCRVEIRDCGFRFSLLKAWWHIVRRCPDPSKQVFSKTFLRNLVLGWTYWDT